MKKFRIILAAALIGALLLGITACGSESASTTGTTAANQPAGGTTAPKELKKLRVGYFGNTCEAGVFAPY